MGHHGVQVRMATLCVGDSGRDSVSDKCPQQRQPMDAGVEQMSAWFSEHMPEGYRYFEQFWNRQGSGYFKTQSKSLKPVRQINCDFAHAPGGDYII